MTRWRGPLVALIAGSLWACFGGADSSAPASAAEFAEALTDQVCSGVRSCCLDNGLVYDEAGCRANGPRDEVTDAKHYDTEAAEACMAGVASALAECGAVSHDAAFACERVLYGDKAPGEACQSAAECARPAGDRALALCASFCVHITLGGSGAACGSTGDFTATGCDEGLSCVSGICRAGAAAVGVACGTNGECPSGLGCNPDTCTCEAALAEGAACSADFQCASELCVGGTCRRDGIASEGSCGRLRAGTRAAPFCPFGNGGVAMPGGLPAAPMPAPTPSPTPATPTPVPVPPAP